MTFAHVNLVKRPLRALNPSSKCPNLDLRGWSQGQGAVDLVIKPVNTETMWSTFLIFRRGVNTRVFGVVK